jgi:hypothetical protein
MRAFAAILLSFLFIGNAHAQYDRLTGNSVFLSIQCDMGKFAAVAAKAGLDQATKAHVSYSWTVEKSTKVSGSIGLAKFIEWIVKGPSLDASATWTRSSSDSIDGNLNINQGNATVCKPNKKSIVYVGIFDCFKDSAQAIKAKFVKKCEKTQVFGGTVTANGTFQWTIIQVGASGNFDAKVTYKIEVDAPAKEAKENDKENNKEKEKDKSKDKPS